jgi:Uma2 family endonuclease
MNEHLSSHPSYPGGGRPTWEVALLFPPQGSWTEEEYLNLEERYGDTIRVELSNGNLEVLPVPTQTHQLIVLFLVQSLTAFTTNHAPGMTLFSGIRVRLGKGKRARFREPDVVYMKAEHAHRRHDEFWEGADLAMEVVSGDAKDRERDLVTKPKEYAAAGIAEYWIIDPDERRIRVLTLVGKTYRVHGEFGLGTEATSVLLPGFRISVDAALTPPGSR